VGETKLGKPTLAGVEGGGDGAFGHQPDPRKRDGEAFGQGEDFCDIGLFRDHELEGRAGVGDPIGETLGEERKHWFRDKFGNGRFRLFFRYDLRAKIIVYVWVNDETTLRTYGAKSDAYAVFASMLNDGNLPDSWDRLLDASKKPDVQKRVEEMLRKIDKD